MHHSLFVGQDCVLHFLIPKNTGSGEPKIKEIGEKFQDNNEFILHNDLINVRGKKITDMVQGFEPPIMGYLYNDT